MTAQEQNEKERLFDKVVEFKNSLDDYANEPYNFGVFITDIERSFAEWLFQDRQQVIDKVVAEVRIEENESIRHMLAETIELGRDWCYNHDKYVSQCYACQTAKWTKIIARMYLQSIRERLAQLHEQKKIAPEK